MLFFFIYIFEILLFEWREYLLWTVDTIKLLNFGRYYQMRIVRIFTFYWKKILFIRKTVTKTKYFSNEIFWTWKIKIPKISFTFSLQLDKLSFFFFSSNVPCNKYCCYIESQNHVINPIRKLEITETRMIKKSYSFQRIKVYVNSYPKRSIVVSELLSTPSVKPSSLNYCNNEENSRVLLFILPTYRREIFIISNK